MSNRRPLQLSPLHGETSCSETSLLPYKTESSEQISIFFLDGSCKTIPVHQEATVREVESTLRSLVSAHYVFYYFTVLAHQNIIFAAASFQINEQ